MSLPENDSNIKKSSSWKKAVKIVCWSIVAIVVAACLALWGFSIYFSPDRIARLIEKESPEYIDGEIKLAALDYKLFSTWPWLEFEADSLLIISHSLKNLPKDQVKNLPPGADSLAFVKKLHGKINIKALVENGIDIKDIFIVQPEVNIIIANDSVNNFSIVSPDKIKKLKKPEKINVGELKIDGPLLFSLSYMPEQTDMKADINNFYLAKEGNSVFDIGFDGTISGRYGELTTPKPVPITFSAKTAVHYPDIAINLSDLSLSLGDISLDLKADLSASPSAVDIKQASAEISLPDLFAFIEELPSQISRKIPLPEGLSGNLPVRLTVELLQPFKFNPDNLSSLTPENLPAVNARVFIDDAGLRFAPGSEKPIEADDIYLEAEANFIPGNPAQTWIKIPHIKMAGEGLALDGSLLADNLTGNVQDVKTNLNFSSSLMATLSYLFPGSGYKLSGELDGNIDLEASLLEFGKKGVKDVALKGTFLSKFLGLKGKNVPDVALSDISVNYDARLPQINSSEYQGSKIDFSLKAKKVKSSSGKKQDVEIANLTLNLNVSDTAKGGAKPDGIIRIGLADMKMVNNGTVAKAQGLKLNARGRLLSSPAPSAPQFSLSSDADSDIIEDKISHTPLYLEYEGGGMIQSLMSLLSLKADLSLQGAYFSIPSYLYPFEIKDASLSTDLNSFSFEAGHVGIGRTGFSIAGNINGIEDFMTAYYPVLLTADADIEFSNVDINQLSWGYYGALMNTGNDSVFYIPPVKPYTPGDSTCVLIPRNIQADIRLRSNRAEYMQYQFSPLSTDIIIKDGVATLKRLTVGAPYATVAVDWTYSTRQFDNIFMNLKANVERFDFESFYSVFPQVVSKAKELENLSGNIAADIDCNFLMYPSMFMTAPSLKAKFDIRGSNFRFVRTGKIERLTHLMLIHGDQPIDIRNFEITGGFHDNLLQINPFRLNFDGYQIGLGGINNMNGDIYYHIALEKSPFHLPFGVNVEGNMKRPEVTVGGTSFDSAKDSRIIENLEWDPQINIMAYLKNGWLQFIEIAAKYAGQNQKNSRP